MDLSLVSTYFGSTHYCLRGFEFTGQLSPVTTEAQSQFFYRPRRLMKVAPGCPLLPGDVIRVKTGKTYLVGDHGPSELFDELLHYRFRLFEVTDTLEWEREISSTKNPTTGLDQKTTGISHIPVALEYMKSQEDEMRIQGDIVRIISASALKVNDRVGNFLVTNVEDELGLRFCTARRL